MKAFEGCTFVPNQAPVQSHSQMSKTGGGNNSMQMAMIQPRNTAQFLEDQKKKEEERLMKISIQMELNLLKEAQGLTGTP